MNIIEAKKLREKKTCRVSFSYTILMSRQPDAVLTRTITETLTN